MHENPSNANASSVPALVAGPGELQSPVRDLAGQIVDNTAGSR